MNPISWLRQTLGLGSKQKGLPSSANEWQYFQTGARRPGVEAMQPDFEHYPPVVTCQQIISQDLSRIPIEHRKVNDDGSHELITNRAPARLFRKPNSYQVKSDWVLFLARSLLGDGNAYAVAQRNDRNEVVALYPLHPHSCHPYITPDGGVIYSVGGGPTVELAQIDSVVWLPARDVLHMRGPTPVHPLIGESPLVAAVWPTLTGQTIQQHNANFFHNMSRPSGLLRHPGTIEEEGMKRIKAAWKRVSTSESVGEIAVLAEGMDWTPLTMTAVDSEVAKIAQLSERQIFQLYRVPPFLGSDLEKATFNNVENLMRFYVFSTLSYWENMFEENLTDFLRLPADEVIKFNVDQALLEGDLKTRVDAYTKGIQGGLYAPDEARARENLPPVDGGNEVYVQQQMRPLSIQAESLDITGAPPPAANDDDEMTDEEKDFKIHQNVAYLRNGFKRQNTA